MLPGFKVRLINALQRRCWKTFFREPNHLNIIIQLLKHSLVVLVNFPTFCLIFARIVTQLRYLIWTVILSFVLISKVEELDEWSYHASTHYNLKRVKTVKLSSSSVALKSFKKIYLILATSLGQTERIIDIFEPGSAIMCQLFHIKGDSLKLLIKIFSSTRKVGGPRNLTPPKIEEGQLPG